MRNLNFAELTPNEFEAFASAHPLSNFQQTLEMGKIRVQGGARVAYLGVWEDKVLVAAAALVIYRSRLSSFGIIFNGPLLDLRDTELLRCFLTGCKAYAKSAGCTQIELIPETPYRIRDSFGKELPGSCDEALPAGVPAAAPREADVAAFEALISLGLIHSGFDHTYNAVPRWRYIKNLSSFSSERELLDSYTKNTRRDIRIAAESFVTVRPAHREELSCFHALCEMSAEKQGFDNRPLSYYEELFDGFGDKVEFNLAFVDMPAYLASWEHKRAALAADIEKFEAMLADSGGEGQFRSHKKAQRQLNDAREKHTSACKRIAEAKELISVQGEQIAAAAALSVWSKRECIYLFSGADQRLARFCAPNYVQHQVMRSCLERGISRYNFYGINGIFDDPTDPGRGLLEFKQGFGGYVEELMGSFTLPVKPLSFAVKQLAHRILGR